MKRQLCFFVVTIVITVGYAQAQTVVKQPDKRWGFGVFAGVNYAIPRVIKPYPVHYTGGMGWLAGVDVSYRLDARSSLHVQPSLMHLADIEANRMMSRDPGFTVTLLKLPVSYRYYVSPTRRLLFVDFGASYNQIVASNYRENLGFVCITGPCPLADWVSDNLTPVTKFAVSIMAGVGVDIPVQKVTVPIVLRYEHSPGAYIFSGIYDQSPTTPVRFHTISLTTGVNF